MSWQLIDPNETRGPDKAVAVGCGALSLLLVAASAFAAWEVFVRGCGGAPHGCGYLTLGGLTFLGLAAICAAVAYWLYPRAPRSNSDQAT